MRVTHKYLVQRFNSSIQHYILKILKPNEENRFLKRKAALLTENYYSNFPSETTQEKSTETESMQQYTKRMLKRIYSTLISKYLYYHFSDQSSAENGWQKHLCVCQVEVQCKTLNGGVTSVYFGQDTQYIINYEKSLVILINAITLDSKYYQHFIIDFN